MVNFFVSTAILLGLVLDVTKPSFYSSLIILIWVGSFLLALSWLAWTRRP